jgi:hypothetical protein
VLKLFKFAVVSGLLLLSVDLKADPYPHRKPGLWELTASSIDQRMPPNVSRLCIDAATESALINMGTDAAKSACSKNDVQVSGSNVTADMVCKFGEREVTTHAVTTFTGDSAFHTEANVHFEPPVVGKSDRTTTHDGKWVGPCGPDMKPGDLTTANGIKMNIAPSSEPSSEPQP